MFRIPQICLMPKAQWMTFRVIAYLNQSQSMPCKLCLESRKSHNEHMILRCTSIDLKLLSTLPRNHFQQGIWLRCLSLSRVQLFVTPRTVAHQAPLSMKFSRQEYWSRLPCPSPGDLPDPGIKLWSPALGPILYPLEPPEKPYTYAYTYTWEMPGWMNYKL